MKYTMITVGCLVMMYGYHRLCKWLSSFEKSHDPQDNW